MARGHGVYGKLPTRVSRTTRPCPLCITSCEHPALAVTPEKRMLLRVKCFIRRMPAKSQTFIGRKSMMRRSMLSVALLGAFVLAATAVHSFVPSPFEQAPAEQVGMSAKKLERIREALKGEIDK